MTEDEFITAYDRYADAIFRHCFFRCFDRELARDMVQETFIKTWEYLAAGKEVKNIRAFLYRVATNLLIDHSRKKKELSLDELKEQGFDPVTKDAREPLDFMEVQVVLRALKKLPEIYRETVTMRYLQDLTPEEIGEILGLPANTVSVRIHRGIEQLRKISEYES